MAYNGIFCFLIKKNNSSTQQGEWKGEKTFVQKAFKLCCLFMLAIFFFPVVMSTLLPGGPNQAIT